MSRSNGLKEKKVSVEDIMYATNNGEDIFKSELNDFSLTTNISSPFRKDANPSFRVKKSKTSGIYIFTDYTTGDTGNAIHFIQKLYNLTFPETLDKIAWNFGLKNKEGKKTERIKLEEKPIIESKPILYEYEGIPFKKKEHLYWNRGELQEDFLKKHNIFSASKIAINKKVIKIPSDEMCFIYDPDDVEGIKILRIGPNIDKSQKWRTNIHNSYIYGYTEAQKEYVLNRWIIKSRKDEMVAKLLGFDTMSIQSENGSILDENMPKLLPLSDNIILCMGSDKQAVDMCKPIQQKYNTKYYNTPKNVLPIVNDLFSYVAQFGLKSLEKHIKMKGL